MNGLADRVAFVTGGNTGIGAAVGERLAAEGARVAIGYLEEPGEAEPPIAFPPYDVYPPDPRGYHRLARCRRPPRSTAAFGEHLVDRFVDLVTSALERELR